MRETRPQPPPWLYFCEKGDGGGRDLKNSYLSCPLLSLLLASDLQKTLWLFRSDGGGGGGGGGGSF